MRPECITEQDIQRWSINIDTDPNLPKSLISIAVIREVCYSGLHLAEQLEDLGCPEFLILMIQEHAGRLSFGRDPWEVCQNILEKYKNNELVFQEDQLTDKN